MKKHNIFSVGLILFFALIFAGCPGMQPIPPADPVCPPPDGQPSFICEQSGTLGVAPETISDFIFDASVIAVLTGVERQWLCDFTKEVGDWYAAKRPLSYADLVNEVVRRVQLIKDPDKLLLLNMALNRHLRNYVNPQLILNYDDELLTKWYLNYRSDLMCEP